MADLSKIAVVGVATTDYGNFPETNALGLGASAFRMALEDSGLKKEEIDGLILCRMPDYDGTASFLGLEPRFGPPLPGAGRSITNAIEVASMALASGAAN